MVKWLSVFLITFFMGSISFAQKNSLMIEGTSPDLYILHKVMPKENFYSIGRIYNVSPKELASYNNLQFENGLSIGQALKIPLKENNFSQSGTSAKGEVFIPLYHHVQPKEGLYRISLNYNKIPLGTIKKWNRLKSDNVSVGTPLIVGYLKVQKSESSLAIKGVKEDASVTDNEKVKPEQTKPEESKPEPIPPVVNNERLPPVKKPDANEQEKKQSEEKPATEEPRKTIPVSTKSTINYAGGYFQKLYNDQSLNKSPVNTTGTAGVFKSTSGWQDGKYYCFNNDAPPGTIIKITNNVTNKSVYAKVLDAIPDIKQNSGLSVIISNAAAEELGTEDVKFDCALTYVK